MASLCAALLSKFMALFGGIYMVSITSTLLPFIYFVIYFCLNVKVIFGKSLVGCSLATRATRFSRSFPKDILRAFIVGLKQ